MLLGRGEKIYKWACIIIVTILALICLYPLLYTLFVSLTSANEWIDKGGALWFFPSKPTIIAYQKIFSSKNVIIRALGISVLRTFIGTFLGVTINATVAFVLSKKDFPGKKIYVSVMLFTILFSGGLIPGYKVVEELGLINTIWAMILPGVFNGWNILIFKQFFENIPPELEDMARIDGVSEFGLFFRIILPLSKAVFAAIALFTMVAHWNSWFDASIYIDIAHKDLWPLQYYTQINLTNTSAISQAGLDFMINNTSVKDITMQMALTVVTVTPMLFIYPFFQKYFTKGVYMGAVKG